MPPTFGWKVTYVDGETDARETVSGEAIEKLLTIQKRNNLNTVFREGKAGPGGAHHDYVIVGETDDKAKGWNRNIQFQRGPRNEAGSRRGVLDTDLLEIVRDRLKDFQKGDYATRENEMALTHIEEALLWMNKRVEDRDERGVLGTTKQ